VTQSALNANFMPQKVTIQPHAVTKHGSFELLQAAHAWLYVTTPQLYNLL